MYAGISEAQGAERFVAGDFPLHVRDDRFGGLSDGTLCRRVPFDVFADSGIMVPGSAGTCHGWDDGGHFPDGVSSVPVQRGCAYMLLYRVFLRAGGRGDRLLQYGKYGIYADERRVVLDVAVGGRGSLRRADRAGDGRQPGGGLRKLERVG